MVGAGSAFSEPDQTAWGALKAYMEGLTDEMFNMTITKVTATWRQAVKDTYF